jgi:hypothetical protein
MERETRNEVILPRREPGEADACDADEARFLRNDLNVAEGTQDVDESPGEVHDRWIGASKEGLERKASTRMPQILRDEARTTPWADPHRGLRGWHRRSLLVSGCDPDTPRGATTDEQITCRNDDAAPSGERRKRQ